MSTTPEQRAKLRRLLSQCVGNRLSDGLISAAIGALPALLDDLDAAVAEAAVLRDVLTELQMTKDLSCPSCGACLGEHDEGCKLAAALSRPDPGAALLERLRAAEAVCEATCELPSPPPDKPGKRPILYADGVDCDDLRAIHAARLVWEKAKGVGGKICPECGGLDTTEEEPAVNRCRTCGGKGRVGE